MSKKIFKLNMRLQELRDELDNSIEYSDFESCEEIISQIKSGQNKLKKALMKRDLNASK